MPNERRNAFVNIVIILLAFTSIIALHIDGHSWLASLVITLILVIAGVLLGAFFIGLGEQMRIRKQISDPDDAPSYFFSAFLICKFVVLYVTNAIKSILHSIFIPNRHA